MSRSVPIIDTLVVIKKISSIPSIKRLLETTFPEPHMKAAVRIPPIIFITDVLSFKFLLFTAEIIILEKR